MITIDTIFRSIINFKNNQGNMTLSHEDLVKNLRAMQEILPGPPENPAYKLLYNFILSFFKTCDGPDGPQLPSYEYLKGHYESKEGSEAVIDILTKIKQEQPCEGEEFRQVLREYRDDQGLEDFERILTNANKIARTGMEFGKGKRKEKLQGLTDAISYFAQEARRLERRREGIKLESQIISEEDSQEVRDKYYKVKNAPEEAFGIKTGIEAIDKKGELKNSQLMLIAAYAKQGKTTFALNMAYRALIEGWNTMFVSLEQSLLEIRDKVYIMHTCNPKFKELYPHLKHVVGKLDKNRFSDGKLTPEEEELFDLASKDLVKTDNDIQEYGHFYDWQPKNVVTTLDDIELKMREVQSLFKSSNRDLDLVVIDHVTLLGINRTERTNDFRHDMNRILQMLKQVCLTFNGGRGIRILSPFQISRKCFEEAIKNGGKYDARAFSDYNEAERSADRAIALYVDDDMRKAGQVKIWDILERRYKFFGSVTASVNQATDWIFDNGINEDEDPISVVGSAYSGHDVDL